MAFPAQYCNIIPVPHPLTSLEHRPYSKTKHLLTLTEFAVYAPHFKSVKVEVHPDFGTRQDFIFDGFIANKVVKNPVIEFSTENHKVALSIEIRLDGKPTLTLTSQIHVRQHETEPNYYNT